MSAHSLQLALAVPALYHCMAAHVPLHSLNDGVVCSSLFAGELPDVPVSRMVLSLQSTQRGDYVRPPLLHLPQEARNTAYKQKQSDIPQGMHCIQHSTTHTCMHTLGLGRGLAQPTFWWSLTGDVSKIPFPPTNHQAAYVAHPPITSSPNCTSRRAQALAQIHGSSIQPCDPRINPFQPSPPPQPSNLSLDHLPAAGHPPVILQADMTTSHFPQGDLDAHRVGERISNSTAQRSHKPVSACVLVYKYIMCTCA